MSLYLTIAVAVAMCALAVLEAVRAHQRHEWRSFWLEISGIAGFALFLHWLFDFPKPLEPITAKGAEDFTVVGILFLCMIIGMFAHALYQHFSLKRSVRVRRKVDWGLFFAPVCASPMIFIPLLAAIQNANVDLKELTIPRMMMFFVAFENGFLWKAAFDRRKQR